MIKKRISLGFDLREHVKELRDSGKSEVFLNPDILSAISADPGVWPISREVGSLWNGLLPDFLNPLYLATNLDCLVSAYKNQGFTTSQLRPLCVTSDPTVLISLNKRFGFGYFEDLLTEEALVDLGWQFRGFDVVDLDGLISGLKGCDYREPMWSQLRSNYENLLNSDGLFDDSESAYRFAEVRGLEITQHAPFVVVGILVQDPIEI